MPPTRRKRLLLERIGSPPLMSRALNGVRHSSSVTREELSIKLTLSSKSRKPSLLQQMGMETVGLEESSPPTSKCSTTSTLRTGMHENEGNPIKFGDHYLMGPELRTTIMTTMKQDMLGQETKGEVDVNRPMSLVMRIDMKPNESAQPSMKNFHIM
ncbi:hypothetical protein PAXRUDRAFT_22886 [Paxillus rubicundulus Ve08.2h10]|uniref:Uncharacterized protein n=1 Tax=Paxillus rubicundulus Ve08.2h10 TaxID=930991 RepID=A0A0D0CMF5_9AGAM|nr:hypothetical protein PAXRUDRAFT_22886 [Paxillus rubicundulus Ve08.2h10]